MCSNTNQTTTLKKCWVTLSLWIILLSFVCGLVGYITHRVIQTTNERNIYCNKYCGSAIPYKSQHVWDLDEDDPLLLGERLKVQIDKQEKCQKREKKLMDKLKDWREKTGEATGADTELKLRILQDKIGQLYLAERNLSVDYKSFPVGSKYAKGFIDLPRNIFLGSVGKYEIEKCWRSSASKCVCETKNTTNENEILHFEFDLEKSFYGKLEEQLILHEFLLNNIVSVKYKIFTINETARLWSKNKPFISLNGKIDKNTKTLFNYENEVVVENIQDCFPISHDNNDDYLCSHGNDGYLALRYIYKEDSFKLIQDLKTEDKLRLQYEYLENKTKFYGFINLADGIFTCAKGNYQIKSCWKSNICLMKNLIEAEIDQELYFKFDEKNEKFLDYLEKFRTNTAAIEYKVIYAADISRAQDQTDSLKGQISESGEITNVDGLSFIFHLESCLGLHPNTYFCTTKNNGPYVLIKDLHKLLNLSPNEIDAFKKKLTKIQFKMLPDGSNENLGFIDQEKHLHTSEGVYTINECWGPHNKMKKLKYICEMNDKKYIGLENNVGIKEYITGNSEERLDHMPIQYQNHAKEEYKIGFLYVDGQQVYFDNLGGSRQKLILQSCQQNCQQKNFLSKLIDGTRNYFCPEPYNCRNEDSNVPILFEPTRFKQYLSIMKNNSSQDCDVKEEDKIEEDNI